MQTLSRRSSHVDSLPTEAIVAFESVAKVFSSGVEAVRQIDLRIEPGEFVTIVGPSGCGKSTLLNMTAGLFLPTAGRVLYRGKPVTGINSRTGYMTQVDHLLPWRTVAGNIAVPLEIAGRRKKEIAAEVERLLNLVGLAGFGTSYPAQLSGGMRKRAALARLLAYDPETLLMDEPFGALDAQMRLTLQGQLKKLCRTLGKTVMFVTHDVDEAVALGDKCVVFSPRPGTIQHVLPSPLPRDRDLMTLRFDPRYAEECAKLWRILAPSLDIQNPL